MNLKAARPVRKAASDVPRETFTGNRALDMEEALIFEAGGSTRPASTSRSRRPSPRDSGRSAPRRARSAGPHRAGGGASLRPPVAQQLFDRRRHLSARLVHDEAQPAPQREDGAIAGLCRRASSATRFRPCKGALEVIEALAEALLTMTGMSAVAMSPKAGAHGELCGMMTIKAAIEARGESEDRRVVLVPDSAHGTNPATAALIGFSVRAVPAGEDGNVSASG